MTRAQKVRLSAEYLQLAEQFEGCHLQPYVCPGGHLTIGIGHKIREHECKLYLGGMTLAEAKSLERSNRKEFLRRTAKLTLEQVHDLKRDDMASAVAQVEKRLERWGIFDAPERCLEVLTDLAFNGGPGFLDGTITNRMLSRDYDGAILFSPKFCLTTDARGELVPCTGLTFRRYSFVWYYFTGESWRIGAEGGSDQDWAEVKLFLARLAELLQKRNCKNPLPYPNNLRSAQRM